MKYCRILFDAVLNSCLRRRDIDVLLVIDSSDRELTGILLIQHYLRQSGLSSEICSLHNIHQAYDWWRPKALLLPRVYDPWIEFFSERSFIFILPSEHGNSQRELVSGILFGTKSIGSFLTYADLCFCLGNNTKQWILERKILPQEKILPVGHPNTDQWYLREPFSHLDLSQKKVGFTNSLRFMNNGTKIFNPIRWLYDAEISGGDGSYYLPPQHAESWIHYEAAYLRIIFNLIEKVLVPNSQKAEIRPHPNELLERYEFLSEKTKGLVEAKKEASIYNWLRSIALLFTAVSGSALDAYVRGLPVVSLNSALNRQAFANIPAMYHHDFYNYFWQLENVEQAKEYIDAAFAGQLPPAKDTKELDLFLQNGFHYPRSKPSSALVAEAIYDFLKTHKARQWKPCHYISRRDWLFHPAKTLHAAQPNFFLKKAYVYARTEEECSRFHASYLAWRKDRVLRHMASAKTILQSVHKNK